jgi:hypothetical protein
MRRKKMTREERIEIFEKLSKPLPKEAEEIAKKEDTKKHGDLRYYKYIYVCDRFNKVLGFGGWRYRAKNISLKMGKTAIKEYNGKKYGGKDKWIITLKVVIEVREDGLWVEYAQAHQTNDSIDSEGDAIKGAVTGGFKKAAANMGVGWQVYANMLDPDSPLYVGKERQEGPQKEPREEQVTDIDPRRDFFDTLCEYAARATDKTKVFVTQWGKAVSLDWHNFDLKKIDELEQSFLDYMEDLLKKQQSDQPKITTQQVKKLHVLYREQFGDQSVEENVKMRRDSIRKISGKSSTKDLTKNEAQILIDALSRDDFDPFK